MSGCQKVLFSRNSARVDAILINSAGGLTSGDRLKAEIIVEAGAHATVTTQAAERAYRATDGVAEVATNLHAGDNATLFWLPQELILYEGAALKRCLDCVLEHSARFMLVEPVVFGRAKMGEQLHSISYSDHIAINRGGKPLYRDANRLVGDVSSTLSRTAIAGGAVAMALVIYVGDDADVQCKRIGDQLPASAGASLITPELLVARILAKDSFELRQSLLPMLEHLTDNTIPTSWRL